MSLQTLARQSLANIMVQQPEMVVDVIVAGTTVDGFRSRGDVASELQDVGENGVETGSVYVDASGVQEPGRGDTIKVDGKDVFVLRVRKDPAGALFHIEYQNQKPVTFDDTPR